MATLQLEHKFDPNRKRHYLNGQTAVLHCHHYATLFTQLAIDAKELVDGIRILQETAADVFGEMLAAHFKTHGVTDPAARIDLGVQLFSALGLGKMIAAGLTEAGGTVEMPFAHVDAGWLKKWGPAKHPVNHFGAGYIAGLMAAAYDKPFRSYKVVETQSLVQGAKTSIFKVSR